MELEDFDSSCISDNSMSDTADKQDSAEECYSSEQKQKTDTKVLTETQNKKIADDCVVFEPYKISNEIDRELTTIAGQTKNGLVGTEIQHMNTHETSECFKTTTPMAPILTIYEYLGPPTLTKSGRRHTKHNQKETNEQKSPQDSLQDLSDILEGEEEPSRAESGSHHGNHDQPAARNQNKKQTAVNKQKTEKESPEDSLEDLISEILGSDKNAIL